MPSMNLEVVGLPHKVEMMGTFDVNGNFRPQCVGLGTVAYTSKPGLFTGGMLSMPLSWADHDHIRDVPWAEAVAYVATRWHFLLVNR